ncbi:MAG: (2Fe-2S)-binding protein [Proteobacteria bacterium]|nr:MAG: (2Fe-2S)-binding protein [Pseudomonadota bacterium]
MVFKRFKSSESIVFVLGSSIEAGEAEEKQVRFRPGKTILETALDHDIELDHSCTAGTCGSCRVVVLDDSAPLEVRGEVEAETAAERQFAPNERLACLNLACAGLKVRIP